MVRTALKGILAHRWRLLRTAFAVALGVGFVAGTFVITDTVKSRIDAVLETSTSGTDVSITSASRFDEAGGSTTNVEPIPASVLPTVQAIDGVEHAAGEIFGSAIIVGKDGEPIQPFGPPTLGAAWGSPSLVLTDGAAPDGVSDVAIDVDTASAQGFRVGDVVQVVTQDASRRFRIVGLLEMPEAWTGATLAAFSLPTAQRLMGLGNAFNSISVTAEPGVSPDVLRGRILDALPSGIEAKTSAELTAETRDALDQVVGIFQSVLLVFALVALFVGAFLIFNTFSILVAQRTREIGLLRAVGASRGQILTSVLAESVAVGLLASVFGIGVGILLAIGLIQMMGSGSSSILAGTSLQVTLRTGVVALVTGVVVTIAAALLPAIRATSVPPVVAIGGRVERPAGATQRRVLLGGIVTAAGIGSLLAGLFADVPHPLYLVGAGALVTFIGVAILSVLFARPLAGVLGRPLAMAFGHPAFLGRQNAMRSPRRTASTAAALMIGVALVAFVSIAASSIKASATSIINRDLHADFVIRSSSMATTMQTGVSPGILMDLARALPAAEMSEVRVGQFGLGGAGKTLMAIEPLTLPDMISFDAASIRALSALNDVGVLVRRSVAEVEGWSVGHNLPMQFQRVGTVPTPIQGFFESDALSGADYLITVSAYERRYVQQLDTQVYVKGPSSATRAELLAAIERTIAEYPNVEAMDRAEYVGAQSRQVDTLLVFVQALLALSVIIALLGIANTLGMSILERTRELGLLRAVGMTRGQLRAMVRWEAVIIGVIGALLGLAVGMFFGWALVRAMRDEGFSEFAVPYGQLAVYLVLGAAAGVVAALLPARRAARLNVLEAIAAQ
jgi:putative ABC transport system permease protein